MKKSSKIQIIFCFLVILSFVNAVNSQIIEPDNIFSPFYVQQSDYSIYNEDRDLLHYQSALDFPLIEFDATHQYPGIEVDISQPFITDYRGERVITNYDEILMNEDNIKSYKFETVDGKYLFIQTMTLAVDFATVTRSNFGIPPTYLYKVDNIVGTAFGTVDEPFKRYTHDYTYFDGTEWITISRAELPFGVLYAKVKHDELYWGDGKRTSWLGPSPGTVGIPYSLIPNPLEYKRGIYYDTLDDNPEEFDELGYLATSFGNQRVIVKPAIDFQIQQNLVSYDYYVPSGDGIFKIFSDYVRIGIVNVRQSDFEQSGLLNEYTKAIEYSVNIDDETQTAETAEPSLTSTDVYQETEYPETFVQLKYIDQSAYFQALPFSLNIIGENYLQSTVTRQTIDVDAFIPITSAIISPEVFVQPFTEVKRARYTSQAVYQTYTTFQYTNYIASKSYDIPYGIKINNAYAITRILIDIAILSENSVYYIPVTGEPVQVTDLTAYGLDEFGLLPRLEFAGIQKPQPSWWDLFIDALSDLFEFDISSIQNILIMIVVIVITIAIIAIAITIQRSQKKMVRKF